MLESTYRPGTLTMLECRFNKTTHHVIIIMYVWIGEGKQDSTEFDGNDVSLGLSSFFGRVLLQSQRTLFLWPDLKKNCALESKI